MHDYWEFLLQQQMAMYGQIGIPEGMLGRQVGISGFGAAMQMQSMLAQSVAEMRNRWLAQSWGMAAPLCRLFMRRQRWQREADEEKRLSGWRERIAWARDAVHR